MSLVKKICFDTSVLIQQELDICFRLIDKFNTDVINAAKKPYLQESRIVLLKAGIDPDNNEELRLAVSGKCKIQLRVSVKKFLPAANSTEYKYASYLCTDYNINRINLFTYIDADGTEKIEKILACG